MPSDTDSVDIPLNCLEIHLVSRYSIILPINYLSCDLITTLKSQADH